MLSDWAENRLPHVAEAEPCRLRAVSDEVLAQWKREMGFEAVLQRMRSDPQLDRLAMPPMERMFHTPNVQPEEETLDYSCFLPAAEREQMEEEDEEDEEENEEEEEEEEEVPELVDDEDEDAALLE